jgi:hypothetical protein
MATVAMFVVVACGAGQKTATSEDVPAIPGADAAAGPIVLRDLLIPFQEQGYPPGSDVPLVVRMFSNSDQPVALSQVVPGPASATPVQAQRIALRPYATASAAGGTPPTSMVVPPMGQLQLVPGSGPHLVAEHITAALRCGLSVAISFTFSTGDSVVVNVPMAPPTYPVTGQQTPSVSPQPTR